MRHELNAVVLSIMIASAAHAQQPIERSAILAFRDSIRPLPVDSRIFRDLEHRLQDSNSAKHASGVTELRLGFLQLHHGVMLRDRFELTKAERSFSHATDVHDDWPMAFTGLGLSRLNLALNTEHLGTGLFSPNPYEAVARDFAHSAELDPAYVEGLLQLSVIALQDHHPDQLRAALAAFRQTAHTAAGGTSAVQLARVQIERANGSLDTARALATAFVRREPENALGLLELAHLELVQGDVGGGAYWFHGLDIAPPSVVALYRHDMIALLPREVLAAFDSATTGIARSAVMRTFLEGDDPQHLRTGEERLREHYRRLDYARAAYSLPTPTFRGDELQAFTPIDPEFDDRGRIWVLHGPPDDHSWFNLMGAPPNESWYYRRGGADDLMFHFIKTSDSVGYHRVSSIFDILAYTASFRLTGKGNVKAITDSGKAIETHGASWSAQTAQELLYSRESVGPIYSKMLSSGEKGAAEIQAAERAGGDSSAAHRETWALRYELPLDAAIDVVALNTGATSQLQVAFSISGASLFAPQNAVGAIVYPVRMRVTIMHGDSLVERIDTVRAFRSAAPIADDGALVGRLPIAVPPGDYVVHVALETATRGLIATPKLLHVSGSAPSQITLSDLAMGARSIPLSVRLPAGDTAWLNPLHRFRSAEPMQLYFDVGGVTPGEKYSAQLAIYRAGRNDPELKLGINTVATGPIDRVRREVDLGRLGTGDYLLEVTVTSPAGTKAVRRREFSIVK